MCLRGHPAILYRANVGALSIELANPRHQHEYKVFKRHPLPESMLLLPGVIDSTTNFVEHPEVVADRICQVVEAIGDRSRIIASVDCGFGTLRGRRLVAASVVGAKLQTLQEGPPWRPSGSGVGLILLQRGRVDRGEWDEHLVRP
jgi:5-methyltetrahydropteroyltriglutamate--homocysteine methyltransferase